jgi:peptide/nickel transport system permease protein
MMVQGAVTVIAVGFIVLINFAVDTLYAVSARSAGIAMTIVQNAEARWRSRRRWVGGAGFASQARHLRLGWIFWLCVAWLAGLAIAATAAGALPLSDPLATDIANRLMPPNANFWLGTDQLGRDMLARVVYGARVSLTVASGTALIAAAFGILLGLPAGYFRGGTETLLMGAADIGLAFPSIVLILLVVAYAGAGVINLSLSSASWGSPFLADRAAQAHTFASEFTLPRRALRISRRIMRGELAPNVALPVAVAAVTGMRVIVIEGILCFGPAWRRRRRPGEWRSLGDERNRLPPAHSFCHPRSW